MAAETNNSERCPRAIHRLAAVSAIAAFFLVLAGGLVTSRDAGLAVPDWPLSYGTVNPPRWWAIENVRTEHGHRLIALTVALLTLATAITAQRRRCPEPVRRLAFWAAGLVLLQAILGGIRVLAMSLDLAMIHGIVGQVFFVALALLAVISSPHAAGGRIAVAERSTAHRFALSAAVLVGVQLVAGIIVRHQGADARPLLGNALFLAHGALGLALLVLSFRIFRNDRLLERQAWPNPRLVARLMFSMVCCQVLLGLTTYWVTDDMTGELAASAAQAWLPTFHVGLGGLIWAAALVLAVQTRGRGHRAKPPAALLVEGVRP